MCRLGIGVSSARVPPAASRRRGAVRAASRRERQRARERDREGEIEKGTDAGQYSARMRVRGHEA